MLKSEGLVRPDEEVNLVSEIYDSEQEKISNFNLTLTVKGPEGEILQEEDIYHENYQQETDLKTRDWPEGHYQLTAALAADDYVESASTTVSLIIAPSLWSRLAAVLSYNLPLYVLFLLLGGGYFGLSRFFQCKDSAPASEKNTFPFEELLKAPHWSRPQSQKFDFTISVLKTGDLAVLPTNKTIPAEFKAVETDDDQKTLRVDCGEETLLQLDNYDSEKTYPVELKAPEARRSQLKVFHGEELLYQQKIWFVPYREEIIRTWGEVFARLSSEQEIPGHWTFAQLLTYLEEQEMVETEAQELVEVFYRVRYGEFEPAPDEFNQFFNWLRSLTYRLEAIP